MTGSLCRLMNEALERKGWTRRQFAEHVGIVPIAVSRWLLGQEALPWRHYLHVARVLGIPLPVLLHAAAKDRPEHVAEFERFVGQYLPRQLRKTG